MTAVTVAITFEHLTRGQRGSLTRSPLALAALDVLPGAEWVEDQREWVDIWRGGDEPVSCLLPDEAQDFAFGFDDGDGPGPLTFTLDVPDEALREAA
jgi:hypothetical protein